MPIQRCAAGVIMAAVAILTAGTPSGAVAETGPAETGSAASGSAVSRLATKIDRVLAAVWKQHGVEPSAKCSDGLFLRRVSLDLIGRTPTLREWTAFEANPDRAGAIKQLTKSPEFAAFWARHLTVQWCGHRQGIDGGDAEVFRLWLQRKLAKQSRYDDIVQRVLAAEGESAIDGAVNFLLRNREQAATKASRLFLGVRLDCAQCHDHPFDRWTQHDHGQMQRFFESTEFREVSEGNVRVETSFAESSPPKFLTGAQASTNRWRDEFALFTVRSKPFARTFGNRLWYHFLGRGIVHPIDDFSKQNPAVSKELIEALAAGARELEFDLANMCQAICMTRAYQSDSRSATGDAKRRELETRLFATRSIKPLTVPQLTGSIEVFTARKLPASVRRQIFESSVGEILDEDFSRSWEHRETPQALMTRLTMRQPEAAWNDATVDGLFRRAFCRLPSGEERKLLQGLSPRQIAPLLMHSDEFCLNY